MKIIIGFSRAKSPYAILSKAIMWAESTPFSHVYLKVTSLEIDEEVIFQASGLKVNIENTLSFNEHSQPVEEYEVDVSEETIKQIWKFIYDNLGKSYSHKAFIGLGFVRLCAIFGHHAHNPFKDGEYTYVCSELVAFVLKDYLKYKIDEPEDMLPIDVNNIINYLGKRIL